MKGDAHKSLLWSGVQQFVVFGIQFGVGILLARLLNLLCRGPFLLSQPLLLIVV